MIPGNRIPGNAVDTVILGRNGQLSLPIETYTPERIAEFERESAVDEDTCAAVREALSRTKR
jgi:hypothetical protein